MHTHMCKHTHTHTADPYASAMDFLQANGLPDMYLDQVAEFIIKNAGEYHGPIASGPVDPLTGLHVHVHVYTCMTTIVVIGELQPSPGGARYVPGSGGHQRADGHNVQDPFTGRWSVSISSSVHVDVCVDC